MFLVGILYCKPGHAMMLYWYFVYINDKSLTKLNYWYFVYFSLGLVRDIFIEEFATEQKSEVEAVFNKTSLDWKSWLASHIKAD
jgi:hypothetical protein